MSERVESCVWLPRARPGYPAALERLGRDAPAALAAHGNTELLGGAPVALLCSVRVSAAGALAAYDLARGLRDAGLPVIGGFHSPVERECLDLLLRGRAPLVVCPARAIEGMRIPSGWRAPLAAGRLLLLSRFAERRRPTAAMAEARNQVVAALAGRLLVIQASPGGRLMRLAALALRWGTPVLCPDLPENRDLLVMGATPAGPEARAR